MPSWLLEAESLLSPHLLAVPLSIILSWLIYAALTQIIFTTQVRNPALWSTGTILLLIIVPLSILSIFQKGDSLNPLWLLYRTFFGHPPLYGGLQAVFLWAVGLGIGLQGIVLAALLVLLRHRLQRLRALIQAVGD